MDDEFKNLDNWSHEVQIGGFGKVLGLRERRCADLEIEQIRSNGQQTILVTVISLMMDCI